MKNTIKILNANHAIIENERGQFLQSYNIIACAIIDDIIYFDKKFSFYSKTTSKYQSIFLGIDIKEQKKLIEEGKAQITNLN